MLGCAVSDVGTQTSMTGITRQAFLFGLVGLANTTIGLLTIYAVLYFITADPAIANAVGYAIGLVFSFVLNRIWTFSDTRSIVKVLPRYLIIAAISYLLNLTVVLIGTHQLGIGPYLVQFFGIGFYTVTMFMGCHWFVFQSINGAKNLKSYSR
jgi:putative flippase GtrA